MNREKRIYQQITASLKPSFLLVINDSQKHAGHTQHLGGAGFTGETHYKVIVVSDQFEGLSRLDRQRRINEILSDEFQNGLHALEMKTLTVKEHQLMGPIASDK